MFTSLNDYGTPNLTPRREGKLRELRLKFAIPYLLTSAEQQVRAFHWKRVKLRVVTDKQY